MIIILEEGTLTEEMPALILIEEKQRGKRTRIMYFQSKYSSKP